MYFIKIRKARKSFWEFCKALAPDFYNENRAFLKDLANTLQNLYERNLINTKTNKSYKNITLSIYRGI